MGALFEMVTVKWDWSISRSQPWRGASQAGVLRSMGGELDVGGEGSVV